MAKKVGRPTKYTTDIADKICSQIVVGRSLRSICLAEDMPDLVTIYSWLRNHPEFLKQYDVATSERTETQQEMLLEMGDIAIQHGQPAIL